MVVILLAAALVALIVGDYKSTAIILFVVIMNAALGVFQESKAEGDYVPADLRLLETFNLKIEEAALTGESVPVEKTIAKIENAEIVIGDRKNMAYLESAVTYTGRIACHCNHCACTGCTKDGETKCNCQKASCR